MVKRRWFVKIAFNRIINLCLTRNLFSASFQNHIQTTAQNFDRAIFCNLDYFIQVDTVFSWRYFTAVSIYVYGFKVRRDTVFNTNSLLQ